MAQTHFNQDSWTATAPKVQPRPAAEDDTEFVELSDSELIFDDLEIPKTPPPQPHTYRYRKTGKATREGGSTPSIPTGPTTGTSVGSTPPPTAATSTTPTPRRRAQPPSLNLDGVDDAEQRVYESQEVISSYLLGLVPRIRQVKQQRRQQKHDFEKREARLKEHEREIAEKEDAIPTLVAERVAASVAAKERELEKDRTLLRFWQSRLNSQASRVHADADTLRDLLQMLLD